MAGETDARLLTVPVGVVDNFGADFFVPVITPPAIAAAIEALVTGFALDKVDAEIVTGGDFFASPTEGNATEPVGRGLPFIFSVLGVPGPVSVLCLGTDLAPDTVGNVLLTVTLYWKNHIFLAVRSFDNKFTLLTYC